MILNFSKSIPMILQKLFINLMIVSASKTNKTRKRPYDFQNDEQVIKVDGIIVEESLIDFCLKKKNKKPKDTFLASPYHTDQAYPNFKDKECMKRFLSLFDNLYFNTLLLLNSIYSMYGKELINLNEWSDFKVIGTNENPFEKYIENFEINDLILLNRNSKINSIILEHFQIEFNTNF
ncbi:hypothetical protein NBO_54g0008 [Nosema bombycis CQ1]|uniref:Uncharacterized protein n=1 Tax=Nosema bombycis (strain CQ1 / CVCC 102059) TaxID=578461 RepID=R0KUI1_NOSB1|nr:hypothetical protein NBO_54g0008 [Nosema bombycis CQ1]|eukprot:EOB13862.1 hypothetical protein NBO_54g0008 [Nosema bombycis CQ1]